jgi:hypothetical protein
MNPAAQAQNSGHSIEGTYLLEDLIQAHRLHIRLKRVHLTFILILAAIVLAVALRAITENGDYRLLIPLIAAGILVPGYFLYLPRQVRKNFQKQQDAVMPFKIGIGGQGISFENARGQSTYPWDEYLKWREDEHLMLLYHSNGTSTLLPKRLLSDPVRENLYMYLRTHDIPER